MPKLYMPRTSGGATVEPAIGAETMTLFDLPCATFDDGGAESPASDAPEMHAAVLATIGVATVVIFGALAFAAGR